MKSTNLRPLRSIVQRISMHCSFACCVFFNVKVGTPSLEAAPICCWSIRCDKATADSRIPLYIGSPDKSDLDCCPSHCIQVGSADEAESQYRIGIRAIRESRLSYLPQPDARLQRDLYDRPKHPLRCSSHLW